MKTISTKNAPKAIGPYSQAVRAGDFLFLSGQIAIDPESGKMVRDSIESETEQVLKNLFAVLDAAGFGPGDVVKTTIFLADMALYGRVNRVYAAFFGDHEPARAAVAVAALPKDARVEIQAIAVKG